jgi:hypothetical protein
MEQKAPSEVLLNTRDFHAIRLLTQSITYPQRCFRHAIDILVCEYLFFQIGNVDFIVSMYKKEYNVRPV